jgi:hypothetical protein
MIKRIIRLFIFSIVVFSCSNDSDLSSISIGDNFIKPQTAIVVVDTFSIQLSTLKIDSIPTSESGKLLVGKYIDDYFGKVSSKGYFQLTLPDSLDINENAVFDSLTLSVKYSGDWYGDTLQPQTINVYRVLEDIELNDDSKLDNTSSFKYDETPLGSVTLIPKPNFYDHLQIRLSDELGKEFVRFMKKKTNEISSTEKFIEFFKGLALGPGIENTSILGFEAVDSFLNMVLYTHYAEEERIESTYNFPLYLQTTCFNQIETDRSGTYIENLETQRIEIPSSETGNRVFIEAGGGIVTRIDFPSINRLLEFDTRNILYKAEIILKPYPLSYYKGGLPEKIVLYKTDKYNRLVSEIVATDGSSIPADFYYDELYNENTYFKFDITDFLMTELTDSYFDPDVGLIVTLPEEKLQSSLDRLVLDARNNSLYKPVLKLYFVFYN